MEAGTFKDAVVVNQTRNRNIKIRRENVNKLAAKS